MKLTTILLYLTIPWLIIVLGWLVGASTDVLFTQIIGVIGLPLWIVFVMFLAALSRD